jgi:hypothetical protein
MIKTEVNTAVFEKGIAEYARTVGISMSEAVRIEAKAITLELIRQTPPKSASIGKAKVEADIKGLFRPAEEANKIKISMQEALLARYFAIDVNNLKLNNQILKQRIVKLWQDQDTNALDKIFQNFAKKTIDRNVKYEKAATVALHTANRTRKGGVKKSKKIFVENEKSINKVVATKKRKVGTMKAGWGIAARALGVNMPAWVQNNVKMQNGKIHDNTGIKDKPSITLGNSAGGIAWNNQSFRIVKNAMLVRSKKLPLAAKQALKNAQMKANL